MNNVRFEAKSTDAFASTVSYCRCSELPFRIVAENTLLIDNVGTIDVNTLAYYGTFVD